MINIRSDYHRCGIPSAGSDKTWRTETPNKQWECWRMNNRWGSRSLGVAGTSMSKPAKRRGNCHITKRWCLFSGKMRATAAGGSAAGCKQHLTAGLASSPNEGQSGPHAVGVIWVPSTISSSCQGLEQCGATAILWGQSRAQVLVQNESQTKGFI